MQREDIQELKQRLYQAMCPVCSEREIDGSCGLHPMEHCPIRRHLPSLVALARSLESRRPGEYAGRVEQEICGNCRDLVFLGSTNVTMDRVRQEICVDCRGSLHPLMKAGPDKGGQHAQDAYLLLIVQTIDDFLNEKAVPAGSGEWC